MLTQSLKMDALLIRAFFLPQVTLWGLRDLRASFGASFLKRGGTISELQKIMGHVKPYHTAEIFGRHAALKANINDSVAVQESGEVSIS
jgi:hypothetical protein